MARYGFWILTLALAACGGDEDKDEDKNTGDDTGSPEVVDEDGDGSPAEADCDDDDAHVYPGAPELCDQRANDCDTMDGWSEASEAGTAMFTDSDGNMSDFTAWIAGSEDAPASLTLSQTGQIDLCEGTFYAALDVSADLDLNSHGDVALSGGGQDTILTVLTEDITVTVSGLTLQDGLATVVSDINDEYRGTAGGAINVDVYATVELQDVVLKDNSGEWAGALFAGNGALIKGLDITTEGNTSSNGSKIAAAYGATVQLENLTSAETGGIGLYAFEAIISLSGAEMHNQAVPVYAIGSNVDISGSSFSGNEYGLYFDISESYHCTVEVTGTSFSSNETAISQYIGALTITDSDFTENSGDGTAGVWTEGVALTLTDSRFIDNVSTESWPAVNHFSGSAEISDCEFTGNLSSTETLSAVHLYAGVDDGDDITVSDTSFTDNQNGALQVGDANVITLTNLTFTGNLSGATLSIDHTPALSASNLVFEGNEDTAIKFYDAHGEVYGVSISDQNAENFAGLSLWQGSEISVDDIEISTLPGTSAWHIHIQRALEDFYEASSLQLSNATLSGDADIGISIGGDAVLNNVTIDGTAEDSIRVNEDDSTLTATDLTVTNAGGSCMYFSSASTAITLENTLLETCADTGIKLYDGAGFTATGLVLRNSTGLYTGGIYMSHASEVTLIDSTIEGNSTESASYAGGVALAGEASSITLDNVDFIDNVKADTPADVWHSVDGYEVLGLGYSGTCVRDVGCTAD